MALARSRVAFVGIGGPSHGLARHERGIQAGIFEQATELGEVGVAIAPSANSIREFSRLGLRDVVYR